MEIVEIVESGKIELVERRKWKVESTGGLRVAFFIRVNAVRAVSHGVTAEFINGEQDLCHSGHGVAVIRNPAFATCQILIESNMLTLS